MAASSAEVPEGTRQALAFALRRDLEGEVRFDPGSRHLYATDASTYRHVPVGVVFPRHADDIATIVRHCTDHGVPVTMRGAGTSIAGQAANTGVVVDLSRHLHRILAIDPAARTATVEPGVVLDTLQVAAAPHGLRFGPDPSTHDRCTLGGMIGNDACGVHSLVHGRTVHNVVGLDLLLADGTRMTVGRHDLHDARHRATTPGREGEVFAGLLALRDEVGDLVRQRFPAIPRRVSGYHLDQLLHDGHLDVAKALVGSEGTCATVLSATVRLVPLPAERVQVLLGYRDVAEGAEHVPALLAHRPDGLEGMDDVLVAGAGRPGRPRLRGLDLLPDGGGWLVVELSGATRDDAAQRAAELVAAVGGMGGPSHRLVTDPAEQREVWRIREEGLGAVTVAPGRPSMVSGWEDAGLPPDRLADYLRGLDRLIDLHGLDVALYGHFGDGCIHTRISFDHTTRDGRTTFRRFVEEACELTVELGGVPSGEHGDGHARAELYERVFGPELVAAFRRFKAVWDPDGVMNPGRLVDPLPLDAALRLAARPAMATATRWFALPDDGGDLAAAVSRCVGIGACRRDQDTGAMCPSWMVTHDEQHSTRGRAHLLFEMLRPDSDLHGFDDDAVADALDLCLSCKACKAECPTGVDLATYKAEVLARRYEGRRRPLDHHVLGRVRWWLRLGSHAPGLTNAALRSRLGAAARRAAGVTDRRPAPRLAAQPFSTWWRRRGGSRVVGDPVVLFVDTFTETLDPAIGRAAVAVLEATGHRVVVPDRPVCCGRPLYDHGMLDDATRQLRRLVRVLTPAAHADVPIVTLEPSCLAALRDELPGLLHGDLGAQAVARASRSLAEHLTERGFEPAATLAGRRALVHGHCHARALGFGPDRSADTGGADAHLLDLLGLDWRELDAGCCGLAGSFGFRAGDPADVSVAAGERKLLPAVRAAPPDTLVVADGFSCRTQIVDLQSDADRRMPLHLAQLLASGLGPAEPG